MATQFHSWLKARGEATLTFGRRHNVGDRAVRFLAGIYNKSPVSIVSFYFLQRVSNETGISIETLFNEAKAAAENPLLPRVYRRKQENVDGATQEESGSRG